MTRCHRDIWFDYILKAFQGLIEPLSRAKFLNSTQYFLGITLGSVHTRDGMGRNAIFDNTLHLF